MTAAPRVFTTVAVLDYGSELTLSNEDSRHLIKVLRLEEGSPIIVVSKDSAQEFQAILAVAAIPAQVRILSKREGKTSRSRVGCLIAAIAKGSKNDLVCEKACELGVEHIIFWQAHRSVVQIKEDREQQKVQRWEKILLAAAKQSGNDWVPTVQAATDIHSMLEQVSKLRAETDSSFVCSLSPTAKTLRSYPDPGGKAHIAIGPEGDFSPEEEHSLEIAGFLPLSLGPLTLRCETAAITALATIHAVWGFRS